MAGVSLSQITLDAAGWRSPADIWDALLPALGAPASHGPNLDALFDCLVAGLTDRPLPAQIRIVHADGTPAEVRDYLARIRIVFDDARAQYGVKSRFIVPDDSVAGYVADAAALIPRYEAIDPAAHYEPVIDLLPPPPAAVADIGAGTGRHARWLARRGHVVTAMEPVSAFRHAAEAAGAGGPVTWIDDRLPTLWRLRAARQRFDLVLCTGVVQHLRATDQARALLALLDLATRGGRVIVSLRHDRGAPSRPVHPVDPPALIAAGEDAGAHLLRRVEAASVQQVNREAGVTWTWLAFRRDG